MTLNCSVHYVISLLQGHAAVKIPRYEKHIKGIMVYTMCVHVTSCKMLAWVGNSLIIIIYNKRISLPFHRPKEVSGKPPK